MIAGIDGDPTAGRAEIKDGSYLPVIRCAGYRRSHELLELHRATVERLPAALAEQGELDQNAIERIIAG